MNGRSEHPLRSILPRDERENTFTPILKALWSSHPNFIAVVFSDKEGEWIDYCSTTPAFDTKVMGAHMVLALGSRSRWIYVRCSQRDLMAARVGEIYVLSAMLKPTLQMSAVLSQVERCVQALEKSAGL